MYYLSFSIQFCGASLDKLFWKEKNVLDISHLDIQIIVRCIINKNQLPNQKNIVLHLHKQQRLHILTFVNEVTHIHGHTHTSELLLECVCHVGRGAMEWHKSAKSSHLYLHYPQKHTFPPC